MGKDSGSCGWQAAADRGGGCTRQVAADDGGQALPFQPPRATKPVALLRDTALAGVVSLPFGDPTRLGTWPTTGAWHLWTTATAGLWVVRGASRLWVAVAVVACRRRGVPVWAAGACRAAVAGACRGRPSWSTTDTGGRSIQKGRPAADWIGDTLTIASPHPTATSYPSRASLNRSLSSPPPLLAAAGTNAPG